ncbi:Fe2+-dependent dioxygenase [Extensimonas vulgaris]|uniref:PKHD-type hydroxylase n=1 Tax=Extensimonas vulgaris TaxID=1031594 RepID=A0A369AVX3_9BURK|nr:Fe2+-dependent dioxygenase [Extensimonas vulgaris]RCX11614.1 PKHD-type hydroxylase [Extensimonas vulgaris]TWI40509.1 PKHD-type hydroxylase [Extensimonas vulgaris]TXD16528.1 Fe2+-dependent dioxygenase [Extensimonas vulgaris]
MFLHIPHILDAEELASARRLLGPDAPWVDGRSSAGAQALAQKNNAQLAQASPEAQQLRTLVLSALQRAPLFFSAALPQKIFNPLFNRYSGDSNFYGPHIDGAVLHSQATGQWVRSDISCTLFLSAPDEYDGGELLIQQAQGERRIKLPAGDLILYPGSTVHQVTPVTRGARLASFFWVQSMVRSTTQRELLYDMDMHLLALRQSLGESDPAVIGLTGTYHNLLRLWADT